VWLSASSPATCSGGRRGAGQRDHAPQDRRIAGSHPHVAQCLLVGVESALIGPALIGVLALGGITAPIELPIAFTVGFRVAGAVLPNLTLRSEAARRRRSFNHALSAFLDLVAVNLAAGRGVEGALDTASEAGTGWAFTELRQALYRAKVNPHNLLTSHNKRSSCSEAVSY
jgi:Flp pilus assembly protein TadB